MNTARSGVLELYGYDCWCLLMSWVVRNMCIVPQKTVIVYRMLLMFVCKIWARGHETCHDDKDKDKEPTEAEIFAQVRVAHLQPYLYSLQTRQGGARGVSSLQSPFSYITPR